jgi:hypothetical protein
MGNTEFVVETFRGRRPLTGCTASFVGRARRSARLPAVGLECEPGSRRAPQTTGMRALQFGAGSKPAVRPPSPVTLSPSNGERETGGRISGRIVAVDNRTFTQKPFPRVTLSEAKGLRRSDLRCQQPRFAAHNSGVSLRSAFASLKQSSTHR